MAVISVDYILKYILLNENIRILIGISMQFIAKGPIGNKPALVQIMALHRAADKPVYFADIYIHHSASVN